ncbi:hypothetical protein B0H16DRAFT_1471833 [Mycena metata]|uniref:Uncharacterized protein n=1 Tax=Mycena metata TaxID=1033252 RepID=A0AAD7MNR7_9AGAR|nr:hypothetical protein B0H16DRAFT_1471833 [Mycena metata]
MTAASWRLTGVGPTLAMALARRWLGVGQFLCSFVIMGIFFAFYGLLSEAYFINLVSCSQISLHVVENQGFRCAPGLNPDAEPIQCETQVGGGKNQESTYSRKEMCETRLSLPTLTREQRNWPTPSQRLANAIASVGPTPVKRHEAAAMALAGCVTITQFR